MAASHRHHRRRSYTPRRHDIDTRPEGPKYLTKFVWYRGPHGDHAFSTGSTNYLRSACRAVRFDVRMSLVEGSVQPCTDCQAVTMPAIAPETELEKRAAWGDR